MAANATSTFIGRPGSWHSQVLVMHDALQSRRRLTIKGTGEVELLTPYGETLTGYIPIPQIHRLNATLIQNDFVTLNLPPVEPGTPGSITVAVTNGQRQQFTVTQPPGLEVPPFAAIYEELAALIAELFPKSDKRPGLLKRLFGGKSKDKAAAVNG